MTDYHKLLEKRGLLDPDYEESCIDAMFRIAQRMGYSDMYLNRSEIQDIYSLLNYFPVFAKKNKISFLYEEDPIEKLRQTMMCAGLFMAAQDIFNERGFDKRVIDMLGEYADIFINNGMTVYTALAGKLMVRNQSVFVA